MAQFDQYNIISLINQGLESAIKEVAVDDIVKHQLNEFEAKIRPIIKEHVEMLSFDAITEMNDFVALRNELRLYIKWSDEEKAKMLHKIRETVEVEVVDI